MRLSKKSHVTLSEAPAQSAAWGRVSHSCYEMFTLRVWFPIATLTRSVLFEQHDKMEFLDSLILMVNDVQLVWEFLAKAN